MGKRGPQRTPKEILQARGGRIRKDRYPDGRVAMTASKGGKHINLDLPVEPPKHLNLGAKKIWKEVSSFLHENNLSHAEFNGSLELYCYYLDQHRQLQKFLKENGRTYEECTKYSVIDKIRPEVKMMDEAAKHVTRIAGHFGLTPSTYSQVKVPKSDPEQINLWPTMTSSAG